MLKKAITTISLLLASQGALAQEAQTAPLRPDQQAYLSLFKELVETNTSLSVGSCTTAANRMAEHLRSAGFSDADLTLFSVPDHPKEGGLVATLRGSSKTAKAILLLAHLDVVEAKREDWPRDPFKLAEENGYFYGRGVIDIKNLAATWVDTLIRFRRSGYQPKRTIKMALTCGEETASAFNGAQWLTENRPDLVSAEFALNEGGFGLTDGHGKVVMETFEVGEKAIQNYQLETTNPGGHSSFPSRANAIYQLADALAKVRALSFPVRMNEVNHTYFTKAGKVVGGQMGDAMTAIARDARDRTAEQIVAANPIYNGMLRTTCVATLIQGGHTSNALPQRADANINCRIFPGETIESTREALIAAIGDLEVKVTTLPPVRAIAVPPPLNPNILDPAAKIIAKYLPGVPLIPSLLPGATDAIFLEAIGIPTYGVPAAWMDPTGNGGHGVNERNSVRSLFVSRDILYDLVREYSSH